jgi:hypothetical protein
MLQHQLGDARIASVHAALQPHAWRRMSVRAVALRLVAALDGEVDAVEDHRVLMVELALSSCRWRALTIKGVAAQAAGALETWNASRWRLDMELARLLAEDG